MREFFRSFRCKLGAVTLVVAFIVVGMAITSLGRGYGVLIRIHDSALCRIYSANGRASVRLLLGFDTQGVPALSWWSDPIELAAKGNWTKTNLIDRWHWQGFGFECGESHDPAIKGSGVSFLICPYWSIVLPFLLLTAGLLLSKPRQPKQAGDGMYLHGGMGE